MKISNKVTVMVLVITCLLFGLHIALSYSYQAANQNIRNLKQEQQKVFEDIKNHIVNLENIRVLSQQELLHNTERYDWEFIQSDNILRIRKSND